MKLLPRNEILTGDAAEVLATLPDASVDCVVTSPPYYGVRDYGVPGQFGEEATVEAWVQNLQTVTSALARVLKPSGSMWLNLGDSFSRQVSYGAAPKSLLLGPERVVLALAADGWLVRNKVIWAKTNPMPSSVRDRLSLTWEVLYLLVRSPSYYFDLDAIRVPHTSTSRATSTTGAVSPKPIPEPHDWTGPLAASRGGLAKIKAEGRAGHRFGKNPGDVWQLATHAYRGAHFATFPPGLLRRPILATCPRWVCSDCGLPWGPVDRATGPAGPRCALAADPKPGVVLDPFCGTGTVGLVARELGRDWLGIELNPAYVRLARERLAGGSARELEQAA